MHMLKRLKFLLVIPFIALAFVLAPTLVFADCTTPDSTAEAIQCGADNAAGVPSGSNPTTQANKAITNGINLLSLVVGVIAVIMIIVGGLRFITSGGNQEKVKGAKNTLVYALSGLVIVALAQIIVRFVLNQADTAISISSQSSSSISSGSCIGGQLGGTGAPCSELATLT